MIKICGVDPGLHGALAYVDTEGGCSVFDMPTVPGPHKAEVVDTTMIKAIIAESWGEMDIAVLERPIWLKRNGPVQATSTWFNYGRLTAAFEGWAEVAPNTWKKDMALTKKSKDASLEMARGLFPKLVTQLEKAKDHGRAEALLIAEWYRRQLPSGIGEPR